MKHLGYIGSALNQLLFRLKYIRFFKTSNSSQALSTFVLIFENVTFCAFLANMVNLQTLHGERSGVFRDSDQQTNV